MKAREIYDFAVKWGLLFADPATPAIELLGDEEFPNSCFSFEFQMDAGKSFCEKYSEEAFNDVGKLHEIIADIDDIALLGSAIFSRWRYYSHWAYSPDEVKAPEVRAWFICALSRLAALARAEVARRTTLKKISLSSNCICYGPRPEPEDEVEQHLTICSDGRVYLSKYAYGEGFGKYNLIERVRMKLNPQLAVYILSQIAEYYADCPPVVEATDVGEWEFVMTCEDGGIDKDRGSLVPRCGKLQGISDIIRSSLDMPELLCFDGRANEDRIEHFKIEYIRSTKLKTDPSIIPAGASWDCLTWDYSELIEIDRKTETILYVQNIAQECSVKREYHVQEGVTSFLDSFDADELFSKVEEPSEDLIPDPMETTEYTITVSYLRSEPLVIKGTYDKQGLPVDYPEFANDLFEFLSFYGDGEALYPSRYGKQPRKRGDLMFCNVQFDEYGKTYCYLSDDESISAGDMVIVPVGADNHESTAVVESIEFAPPDEAPFPIEKIKKIIQRIVSPCDDYSEEAHNTLDESGEPQAAEQNSELRYDHEKTEEARIPSKYSWEEICEMVDSGEVLTPELKELFEREPEKKEQYKWKLFDSQT